MKRMARKGKRVSWESSVERDGRLVHLYVPREGKMWLPTDEFQDGDRVRVTVERLPVQRSKRRER